MDNIQIRTENGTKMAVLPLAHYKRLMAALEAKEDANDIKEASAIMARVKSGEETLIPAEVANAILDGTHPIRAWRKHRKLTAEKLAAKAGITRAYLTQIENGTRGGRTNVLQAFARALGTNLDALVN
jgi:DNA-binding XRE family transcriptional regulator